MAREVRSIEQNQEFHSPTEVGTVYIPHEKKIRF